MDLNPLLIKFLIKFAKMSLVGNSYEDEEKALSNGLMKICKCFQLEDKKIFESLFELEMNERRRELLPQSIPLDNSPLKSRYLNEKIWNISDAFEFSCKQLNLNLNEKVLKKFYQLNQFVDNHSKILLIGRSQCGKTLLMKSFVKAKLMENSRIIYHHLMLQLWSIDELFSKYNRTKDSFEQGLLSNLIEKYSLTHQLYLHFDGFHLDDLTAIEHWILNFNQGHLFWEVGFFLFLFLCLEKLLNLYNLVREFE